MKSINLADILVRTKQIIGDRRAGIPAMIPVSRSDWYAGIKKWQVSNS